MPLPFGNVEDPVTGKEREEVAGTCVEELDLPMPALIDGIDDAVGKAYGGWPDRLCLIGKDGKVAYAGAQGPRGFDPGAWEKAIAAEVAKEVKADGPADPVTAPKKKSADR